MLEAGAKKFTVYRYDPDSGKNPRYDTFEIDRSTTAARWCSTR
jgi:succinate dehydrogenase/fumarate reductase-like Fe-S protein